MRQASAPRLDGISNDTKCSYLILSLLTRRIQEPKPSSLNEGGAPYGKLNFKLDGFY